MNILDDLLQVALLYLFVILVLAFWVGYKVVVPRRAVEALLPAVVLIGLTILPIATSISNGAKYGQLTLFLVLLIILFFAIGAGVSNQRDRTQLG